MKTCSCTGHRDIPASKIDLVKHELRNQILQAVEDGYTHFISGMAECTDQIFAAIVAELKQETGKLLLEAAIPYRKRLNNPAVMELIRQCDIVNVHSEAYFPGCFMKRNRAIVQDSQRVIAVYDGREKGGTCSTMRYTHSQEKELVIINI